MKEIEINKDIFESITRHLKDWLMDSGLSEKASGIISDYSGFLLVIVFALILFYIAKYVIVRWVHKLAARSASNWDDVFVRRKVFKRLAYLVPAIIIHGTTQYVIPDYPNTMKVVLTLINAYIVTVIVLVANSVLDSAHDIYHSYEISNERPIKGFIQVFFRIADLFLLADLLHE